VGQAVLDKATNLNSGLHLTDSQSGFRAFAASAVDIFRFAAQGMAIESEMLADAGKAGLRIKEVEIVGCFMALTGILLHSLAVILRNAKGV
jgi:hypothetical protein